MSSSQSRNNDKGKSPECSDSDTDSESEQEEELESSDEEFMQLHDEFEMEEEREAGTGAGTEGEEDKEKKRWTLYETWVLLSLAKKEGRTSYELLNAGLKGKHLRCDDKLSQTKNRMKVIFGKKSPFIRAYHTPVYRLPPGSRPWSKERKAEHEKKFLRKHRYLRTLHNKIQKKIADISESEILISSDAAKDMTEEELSQALKKKGTERKKVREERYEKARAFAEAEAKRRDQTLLAITAVLELIQRSEERNAQAQQIKNDYYHQKIETLKARRD